MTMWRLHRKERARRDGGAGVTTGEERQRERGIGRNDQMRRARGRLGFRPIEGCFEKILTREPRWWVSFIKYEEFFFAK
jgi:hypothetical protein